MSQITEKESKFMHNKKETTLNIFCIIFLKFMISCYFCYEMKCLLLFSDFLLSNEMSTITENISTTIFFIRVLFLSYEPVKVSRIDVDHPVGRALYLLFLRESWIYWNARIKVVRCEAFHKCK